MTSVLKRNHVTVSGNLNGPAMIFAHGYGCDQNMWRLVTPAFQSEYKIVLFDCVGAGKSELSAFDPAKYSSLEGYAGDVLEICDELKLESPVFVGHSVSAMVGILAANRRPGYFSQLVLLGPSPRYINDGDYVGGFTAADIDGLLEFLEGNPLGWAAQMAPVIMGNSDRPELSAELANSFCRTDPAIARHFARVTFTSDNRADLRQSQVPVLILQCSQDSIASAVVGEYVQRNLANSRLVMMKASGHCPHLSAPEETIAVIQEGIRLAQFA